MYSQHSEFILSLLGQSQWDSLKQSTLLVDHTGFNGGLVGFGVLSKFFFFNGLVFASPPFIGASTTQLSWGATTHLLSWGATTAQLSLGASTAQFSWPFLMPN